MSNSNQPRRISSTTKRPAASENPTKAMVSNPGAASHQPKKRPALANLTNRPNAPRVPAGRTAENKVHTTISCSSTKAKKSVPGLLQSRVPSIAHKRNDSSSSTSTSHPFRPCNSAKSPKKAPLTALELEAKSVLVGPNDGKPSFPPLVADSGLSLSPSASDVASVPMDESMSTCESLNSPDIEFVDNGCSSAVASLERKTSSNLHISEAVDTRKVENWGKVDLAVNLDVDYDDPQLCASFAGDIFEHLHEVESKKRPSTDFMERIQKDINASMRAILVDWLVEVVEEYRLVPDTLYLAVNYIDRYLSSNVMNRQRLQLLGVSCMLIAAKYEEISAPSVEEFCYITDNTYLREEVLEMESAVLRHLKFEMTAPTIKCFLRRFVRAAQESSDVSVLQMEFLSSYVAELSLLEYGMLCYAPSTIAASAIFLAKLMLLPKKLPWNPTLVHYTSYKPSALGECVKALHRLVCNSDSSTLPAIRQKYTQHKYKAVATIPCPVAIPSEFFQDL